MNLPRHNRAPLFRHESLVQRFSKWLCCWMLLVQLPTPLLHAHNEALAGEDALKSHLQEHHGAQIPARTDWHWHLVIPWELGQQHRSPSEQEPAPVGVWASPRGPAPSIAGPLQLLPPLEGIVWVGLPSFSQGNCTPFNRILRHCGFLQSYPGIAACVLLCSFVR